MIKLFTTLTLLSLIISCGSDSESEEESMTTYLKFYNASLNAGIHQVYVATTDDIDNSASIGSINFADVSSTIALTSDSYEINIKRDGLDVDDEQITVFTTQNILTESSLLMQIMIGDATEPELIEFSYDTSTLGELDADDLLLELYIGNLSTQYAELDVYVATESENFSEATLLTTLSYKNFSELQLLSQDVYNVYVTQAGSSEIVYEASAIDLSSAQTFILSIRDDSGNRGMAIDRITNSSVVYSYTDEEADAEIRIYNANIATDNIDVYFDDVDNEPFVTNLSPGELTLSTPIDRDIYTISSTISGTTDQFKLRNLVMSIEQDDSKVLFIYPDVNNQSQGLIFDQQTRKLAFENNVRVINIGQEEQDIAVYFIVEGESIETSLKNLQLIEYTESKTITLVNQEFRIYVMTEDENANLRSLYESELMTLSSNTNYLMVLEPDDNEFSGYQLSITEE
jgi:hypothetical protein